MPLSLWISPDMQYGLPARGEARQGASRRALAQTIKQHLFSDPQTYDLVHAEFAQQIQSDSKVGKSAKGGEGVKRIRQALLSLPNADEPNDERTEALFVQSLHTLCALVAEHWFDEANRDRVDEDEAGEEEDYAAFEDETGTSALSTATKRSGAEHFQVRSALARRLRQLTSKWQRSLPPEQRPEDNDWYVMADVVLDALLKSLTDWFAAPPSERRHRDGKCHTEKRIEIVQPELAQRLERLIDILPLSFSPQPLKHPVAYSYPDDPAPSSDDAETYIRIDLIGYRQTNGFLRAAHRGLLDPEHRPPDFERYVAAVNAQQAVAWRINRPLLDYARQLIDLAHRLDPKQDPLGEWIHKKIYLPIKGTRRTFKRPAEFLDNVLARCALEELCPSDLPAEPPAFYLPWKADHRGRIFPETPWFSPQGGDLQRALLEFARGQVLTEAGAIALRRHGANLVERSRLLKDLGITDRQVLTLDERECWIIDHEADILAAAAAPLSESFWRDVADKPMQFLAFCLAYKHWKDAPDAPIHLPIQIDGTCNGIQHIAALTGDRILAEAVNVLPRADGLPADIYSELAAAARENLGRLPEPKRLSDHHQGLKLADAWLAADPHPDAWLNRKTAKGVVMTIPYGASRNAQARAVLETILKVNNDQDESLFIRAWRERPLSASELAELDALMKRQYEQTEQTPAKGEKSAKKTSNTFVKRLTRGLFADQCKAAFAAQQQNPSLPIQVIKPGQKNRTTSYSKPPDNPSTWTAERREWERLRTFGSYVALTLVTHLHKALNRNYPEVKKFSGWLGRVSESISSPRYSKNQLEKLVCETKETLDQTANLSENQIKKLVGAYKKATDTKFDDAECRGLPLLWLTPLGFPVAQNKFTFEKTTVNARIGSQPVNLNVQRLTEEVDSYKQRAALLPNLIHSLDATHLMMTLRLANERGVRDIGSIHDCLLCHPNQAETLAQTVREAFAYLYAPDNKTGLPKPLADWHGWMKRVVELRTLPRRGEALIALQYPDGQGEKDLKHEAESGKPDAIEASEWLKRIRDDAITPASERFLLQGVLNWARELPTPKNSPVLPDPPVFEALPLVENDGCRMSPYFFS